MTRLVDIEDAPAIFDELLAHVAQGEEVHLTRVGNPIARLMPIAPRRQFGLDRGVFEVPDDIDAPLPDDLLDAFES